MSRGRPLGLQPQRERPGGNLGLRSTLPRDGEGGQTETYGVAGAADVPRVVCVARQLQDVRIAGGDGQTERRRNAGKPALRRSDGVGAPFKLSASSVGPAAGGRRLRYTFRIQAEANGTPAATSGAATSRPSVIPSSTVHPALQRFAGMATRAGFRAGGLLLSDDRGAQGPLDGARRGFEGRFQGSAARRAACEGP